MTPERVARLDAALADAEKKLQHDPNSLDALFEKASMLSLLGQDSAAMDSYVALLHRDPTHFRALTNLAALALASGHRSAAMTAYRQAAEQHPDNPVALVNLAGVLLDDVKAEEACALFEAALKIDSRNSDAHRGMARALSALGDDEAAEPHWRKGFAGGSVAARLYRGRGTAPRVLLLVSVRTGNIPTQLVLDDKMFAVSALYAEYHDLSVPLPGHDVLFNAIGDADLCPKGLAAAREIARQSTAPLINNPDAVIRTGRAENATRLGALDGVVAPLTLTIPRTDLTAPTAAAHLGELGFTYPLLLRAPGFHTGQHFMRVESADALAASAEKLPGRDVLVMQYLDASGADGLARKYRIMIIDGKFYPVHLAASRDWKVHYFTSDMAARPELREEEKAFLTDMPSVLGARAMSAFERIRDTLGLDYAGVDFALSNEGDVLLFEANATMTILPPGPDPMWDYRRGAIANVLEAARKLVIDRAASSRS